MSQTDTLKSIIQHALCGIILTDEYGVIDTYNNAIATLLGCDVSELVGLNICDMIQLNTQANKTSSNTNISTESADFNQLLTSLSEIKSVNSTYSFCYQNTCLPVQITSVSISQDNDKGKGYSFYINPADGKTSHSSGVAAQEIASLAKYETAQRKPHQSDELNTLTANIPGVVFRCQYNRQRPIEYISDAIVELSGWSSDDFASGRISYTDLMSEEDEYRIWYVIGQSLTANQPYTVEYRLIHRDGHSIWVSENGRIVLDDNGIPQSIVGAVTDNTDVKTKNAEFEGTVHALNRATAVIEFDLHGRVMQANSHFLELMGYRKEEIIGHHHRIFCSPEQYESPDYVAFWERLRNGEVENGEFFRLGKHDKEVWIQATYNPIFDAEGKPYKVMKFATDLSDRRDMEKALREAKIKAEDAMQARGSFLANMSHEIRTPMNAIIGFTEQIQKTPLSEQQQHYSDIVLNASRSLLRLLNEILDMAKLEKGAVEIEVRDFNIHDLIEQIMASLNVSADNKGIALNTQLADSLPAFLQGDTLRIQQVLLNLLNNAIKFTDNGSVTLGLGYENGNLTAQVIDTGIGMKQSYLKTIFDPFTQSEASTNRKYGGTGLGTTICHQLVTAMKGDITVASELGKGTTFTVVLPLPLGTDPSVEATDSAESAGVDLPPLTILIVDDTPTSLELLQITLEAEGHTLTLAHNGEEAVAIYKQNPAFDMIITDIQMPKVNGFEACEMIRDFEKQNQLPNIPIIALSANVLEEHRQLALKVGMNGFSHKPLIPDALFQEMSMALAKSAVSNSYDVLVESAKSYLPKSVASHSDDSMNTNTDSSETATTHHGISKHDHVTVDFDKGLSLWKKPDVYMNALKRFVRENHDCYDTLSAALTAEDADTISAEAHRLRGVSGNLSMSFLFFLMSQIENHAKNHKLLNAKPYIEAIPDALHDITDWLQTKQMSSVSQTDASQTPSHKKTQSIEDTLDSIMSALADIKASAESNQLSSASMKTITSMLPETETSALRKAVDTFDFEKIAACAEQLAHIQTQAGNNVLHTNPTIQ